MNSYSHEMTTSAGLRALEALLTLAGEKPDMRQLQAWNVSERDAVFDWATAALARKCGHFLDVPPMPDVVRQRFKLDRSGRRVEAGA